MRACRMKREGEGEGEGHYQSLFGFLGASWPRHCIVRVYVSTVTRWPRELHCIGFKVLQVLLECRLEARDEMEI